MKKVIIMRGIPGSGKSTKAREIAATAITANYSAVICSTDDYFIDKVDGLYKFDRTKLFINHQKNFHAFIGLIHQKVDVIIVDNTNINKSDFSHYEKVATLNGYDVEHIVVNPEISAEDAHARCIHQVPLETIARMRNSLLASLTEPTKDSIEQSR